jgi:hypothetical protein
MGKVLSTPFGMQKAMMLAVAASGMTSCADRGPTYPEPVPDPMKTATLKLGHRSVGFLSMTDVWVDKVNGMPLKLKTKFSKGGLAHTVTAGKSVISLIFQHTSPTYSYGQLRADADVKVELKPGVTYEGYGEVHNRNNVTFWFQEQGSKKRVSEVITMNPEKIAPPSVTVFIP